MNRFYLEISVTLKNTDLLQLPLNQNLRQIKIDPNESDVNQFNATLICYNIHLIRKNENIFAFLFKNIHPSSIWYNMRIRDGDRLITLNEQDVTQLSYEDVYSILIEKNISFTCQVVWHPELYIHLGETKL